jgi:hypothetical protein
VRALLQVFWHAHVYVGAVGKPRIIRIANEGIGMLAINLAYVEMMRSSFAQMMLLRLPPHY